ncbi:MAG: 30S ribosomal protein S4 [bacterium]
MIIGPKYKIARRLGAPVFEKTQTKKYAFRMERKSKVKKGFSKPKSEFAFQMNEKQKARFVYCLSERQFSNYIKDALSKKNPNKVQLIFEGLESRLDNVVYRMGFASTRLASKQMVSHGHIMVNGKRVNIPSMKMYIGDKISIREASKSKPLFATLDEKISNATIPAWIKLDGAKKEAEIVGVPQFVQTDSLFDLNAVVEFYSR